MRLSRGIVVAFAVASVLALSACGASPSPTPSPTASNEAPTRTPTPIPTADPNARPEQVFGGDCGAVIPGAIAKADFPHMLEVEAIGGVRCEREDTVLVVPAVAAGDTSVASAVCRSALWGNCVVGKVSNGYWFVAIVGDQSAADAVLAEFATSAAGVAAPVLPVRPSDAWTVPECSALSIAGAPLRDGNGAKDAVLASINAALGYRECGSTDDTFAVEFLPGTAWAIDVAAALPGATPATVAGADSAWIAPLRGTSVSYLYVGAGSNLLIVEPHFTTVTPEDLTAAAADLLATLG